jgi:hypothetical protein
MQIEQGRIEEFIVNLLSIGFSREQVVQRAYDFAIALQTDNQEKEDRYVSATMMAKASAWVKYALPNAQRTYERSRQMR